MLAQVSNTPLKIISLKNVGSDSVSFSQFVIFSSILGTPIHESMACLSSINATPTGAINRSLFPAYYYLLFSLAEKENSTTSPEEIAQSDSASPLKNPKDAQIAEAARQAAVVTSKCCIIS